MQKLLEKFFNTIDAITKGPKSVQIAIVVGAIVLFILFIAFLQRTSKAKCPKCKKRKCKEVSSRLLSERRERRSRTVNGNTEYYDQWIRQYNITYECTKCGCRFDKKEKRYSEH